MASGYWRRPTWAAPRRLYPLAQSGFRSTVFSASASASWYSCRLACAADRLLHGSKGTRGCAKAKGVSHQKTRREGGVKADRVSHKRLHPTALSLACASLHLDQSWQRGASRETCDVPSRHTASSVSPNTREKEA